MIYFYTSSLLFHLWIFCKVLNASSCLELDNKNFGLSGRNIKITSAKTPVKLLDIINNRHGRSIIMSNRLYSSSSGKIPSAKELCTVTATHMPATIKIRYFGRTVSGSTSPKYVTDATLTPQALWICEKLNNINSFCMS